MGDVEEMACRSRSRSSPRGAIRTRTAASGAEAEAKAAAAEIIKHLLHSMPRSWQPGEPYILWTDFRSPELDTHKGRTLSLNAENLQKKNCTFNAAPLQMIHILNPPKQLIADLSNAVHVLASPAPNMPDGQRSTTQFTAFTMKRDGFYHWMWHSPPTSAIVMTYSARACTVEKEPRMDFWVSPIKEKGADIRNLWVGFVHFEKYRPSAGLHEDYNLSDESTDTMAAIYAPPSHIKKLVFTSEGLVDVRLTIQAWLETCSAFPVVTYCAWTGELEGDIASV